MTESPLRYQLIGGYVFDRISEAPVDSQISFLAILRGLVREPTTSSQLDIQRAREMGEDNRFIAFLDGVMVNYIVVEGPPGFGMLIDVFWVPDV